MELLSWQWYRGALPGNGVFRMIARRLAEFLIVTICALAFCATFAGIAGVILKGNTVCDFQSFWAAGRQAIHHADPYDRQAVWALELANGYPANQPVMLMRNPPSALPLTLPYALFRFKTAAFLWSFSLIACLSLSIHLLWRMHGRQKNNLHLLGYLFAPALCCVLVGQTGLFVLLGIVIFLTLHQRHPFLAGCSLWFCALKPHILLPFACVLLLWIVVNKAYAVLGGAAASVGAATGIVFVLDPSAWSQYRQMLATSAIATELIPCLSMTLQRVTHMPLSQYLLAFTGCIWAITYFWKRRRIWSWAEDGSLLLLVSVAVAPYAWLTDQAIVLPALLLAAYRSRNRSYLLLFALLNAVIEGGILFRVSELHSYFYLWTGPAWLAWYLFANRQPQPRNVYEPPPADRTAITI
jgi:hypothetical protein